MIKILHENNIYAECAIILFNILMIIMTLVFNIQPSTYFMITCMAFSMIAVHNSNVFTIRCIRIYLMMILFIRQIKG